MRENRERAGQSFTELRERHRVIREQSADYGVTTHIVKSQSWPEKHNGTPAYSSAGEIYVNENVPEDVYDMLIPHEVNHIMQQTKFKPYLDFVSKVPDMVNTDTESGRRLLESVADHIGVDIFSMTAEQADMLYDELNATVAGAAIIGRDAEISDRLNDAFKDYPLYKNELFSIHEQFKKEGKNQ